MSQTTTLATLRQPETSPAIAVGFDTVAGFEALQRMAKMFAKSPITPDQFRKPYVNEKGQAKGEIEDRLGRES